MGNEPIYVTYSCAPNYRAVQTIMKEVYRRNLCMLGKIYIGSLACTHMSLAAFDTLSMDFS